MLAYVGNSRLPAFRPAFNPIRKSQSCPEFGRPEPLYAGQSQSPKSEFKTAVRDELCYATLVAGASAFFMHKHHYTPTASDLEQTALVESIGLMRAVWDGRFGIISNRRAISIIIIITPIVIRCVWLVVASFFF